mgnify:FL=1
MDKNREVAIKIIELFEELLEKYEIQIPSEDRENNPDEASIFGTNYYNLEDGITKILEENFCND